jgi:hypothetical protein
MIDIIAAPGAETGYPGKTWNILGQVYFPKAHKVNFLPPDANDLIGSASALGPNIALNIKLLLFNRRGPVSIARSDLTGGPACLISRP